MKRVSVFLVCLFFISIFPTHHYRALQESSPINSSNTQSVGQPDILAITHPKQTTCSVNGGCMNELFVGDDVHFSAFITNSGDANIETMSLTVSIFLTDSSQTKGGQAKDASGNDLVWENTELMCDDGSVCDFDSTVNPLSPGQFLDSGEYRLQNYNYTENIFYLRLGKDLPENNWRERYIRGYLSKTKNNQIIAMPISNQDSSSLSSFAKANILIIRDPNAKKIKRDSLVKAFILN